MSNPKALPVEKHTEKLQCSKRVYGPGAWSGSPCSKPATMREDGKPWCAIHSPEAKAKREAAAKARYDDRQAFQQARWDAQTEQRRRAECYPALLEALKPFAEFARQFEARPVGALKMGAPLPDSHSIYGIHSGTEWAAELTLGSLRNALRIVAQAEGTQP